MRRRPLNAHDHAAVSFDPNDPRNAAYLKTSNQNPLQTLDHDVGYFRLVDEYTQNLFTLGPLEHEGQELFEFCYYTCDCCAIFV